MMLGQLRKLCVLAFAAVVMSTVAAIAPAGAVGLDAPDEAAAEVSGSEVGPLALAPPCVRVGTRSDFWSNYTDVTNLCGYSLRVKVIIAWGFDSPCHHLDDGDGFTHAHGGNFDRLELC